MIRHLLRDVASLSCLLVVSCGCVQIKPTGDLIYKPAVVSQGDGRDYLVEQDNDGAKVDVSGGKLK